MTCLPPTRTRKTPRWEGGQPWLMPPSVNRDFAPILYNIQTLYRSDLNHGDWQQARLQATVEFRPTWAKDWTGTLALRTTWQEA